MLAIHCCWLNTAIDYAYRTFGKSRINLVKAICYENYCIETYYKVLKKFCLEIGHDGYKKSEIYN